MHSLLSAKELLFHDGQNGLNKTETANFGSYDFDLEAYPKAIAKAIALYAANLLPDEPGFSVADHDPERAVQVLQVLGQFFVDIRRSAIEAGLQEDNCDIAYNAFRQAWEDKSPYSVGAGLLATYLPEPHRAAFLKIVAGTMFCLNALDSLADNDGKMCVPYELAMRLYEGVFINSCSLAKDPEPFNPFEAEDFALIYSSHLQEATSRSDASHTQRELRVPQLWELGEVMKCAAISTQNCIQFLNDAGIINRSTLSKLKEFVILFSQSQSANHDFTAGRAKIIGTLCKKINNPWWVKKFFADSALDGYGSFIGFYMLIFQSMLSGELNDESLEVIWEAYGIPHSYCAVLFNDLKDVHNDLREGSLVYLLHDLDQHSLNSLNTLEAMPHNSINSSEQVLNLMWEDIESSLKRLRKILPETSWKIHKDIYRRLYILISQMQQSMFEEVKTSSFRIKLDCEWGLEAEAKYKRILGVMQTASKVSRILDKKTAALSTTI